MFKALYQRCVADARQRGRRKFRFKRKLLSLDATLIPLCLSMFDWAQYRRSKGAVKLHLVLDHDGYLPRFAVITDGKSSDIEVARGLEFEPGTMLVIDRGYQDFAWWLELSRRKVFFVTRLKNNAEYGIVEQREPDSQRGILRDEVVVSNKLQEAGPAALMRRIELGSRFIGSMMLVTECSHPALLRPLLTRMFFKAVKIPRISHLSTARERGATGRPDFRSGTRSG